MPLHLVVGSGDLQRVRIAIAADCAARERQPARHGVGAVLAELPGVVRWDRKVLSTRYPLERTVHLGGRGITLVPNYFCWENPVTFIDDNLPPVLVYSARPAAPDAGSTDVEALGRLVGPTRARCLDALRQPRTTSELAACLGSSVATASKHASVPRENGLITSSRRANAAVHHLTPLGASLL